MHKPHRRLAFVDLETTGLGPTTSRIAEIGVVTLDGEHREEWGTLVNPGRLRRGERTIEGVDEKELADAPCFDDIAKDLALRLEGRLLLAHNARFDHAFLKAEFARVGISLDTPALCTVMLSRKLWPEEANHDLDSLALRHGLEVAVRHRALPDARLLCDFWLAMRRKVPARFFWAAVGKLLAEPLLPPQLRIELIEALPEKPGVYAMRARDGRALRIARAANLRREAKAYFRLDRISSRAAKLAARVENIEWQACEGELASRLAEIALRAKETPVRYAQSPACSIRMEPASPTQVAQVVPAASLVAESRGLYGLFETERKAGNALSKLAAQEKLCHRALGLAPLECGACGNDASICGKARAQNLARTFGALATLRLPPWPYAGPVGVREGRTVHVFDQWQHLGSARTAPEIAELAGRRPHGFNAEVYGILTRALPRLGPRRLKTLRRAPMVQA